MDINKQIERELTRRGYTIGIAEDGSMARTISKDGVTVKWMYVPTEEMLVALGISIAEQLHGGAKFVLNESNEYELKK